MISLLASKKTTKYLSNVSLDKCALKNSNIPWQVEDEDTA